MPHLPKTDPGVVHYLRKVGVPYSYQSYFFAKIFWNPYSPTAAHKTNQTRFITMTEAACP